MAAEGTSSAPRLANSSAASFPGRNECPGTHCSLLVQEEKEEDRRKKKTVPIRCAREFEVKGKMEKTVWRESEKRNGRHVGSAETSVELSEWRRLQSKNLNKLGLPKGKGCLSATK